MFLFWQFRLKLPIEKKYPNNGEEKVVKMGKEPKTVEVVKTTESGDKKVACRSTLRPRKNEVGVYAVPKLNIIGMATIQKTHPEITGSKELEKYLAGHFQIPETGFGSLGEYDESWKCLYDGQPFVGKDVAQIPPANVSIEPPALAVADESENKDEVNVGKVIEVLNGGKHKETDIFSALVTQKGKEKATEIWKAAKTKMAVATPPAVELAPAEFSF